MTNYEPELGQSAFGQPWKEFEVPFLVKNGISIIKNYLTLVFGESYSNPFENTGAKFSNDVFEVEAYNWDDEVEQLYNFKCGSFEMSWYKYFGRGMSMNKEITEKELKEIVDKCIRSLI